MNSEQETLHDIINKLTVVNGKLNRVIAKSDDFSKEEIVEMLKKAKSELDLSFAIIKGRKLELEQ